MPVYVFGVIEVADMAAYAKYQEGARRALAPFRGRFRVLASGGDAVVYEGERLANHMFVFEFESRQVWEEFYHSAAYRDVIQVRLDNAATKTLVLMEGKGGRVNPVA